MAGIIKKVKNFFSGKVVLKTKRCAEKEEQKAQPEKQQTEEKPKEQK